MTSIDKLRAGVNELVEKKMATNQAIASLTQGMTLGARGNAWALLRRADGELRRSARDDYTAAGKMMDGAVRSFEALPHSERTSTLWRTALPLVQSWRGASEEMHRMLDDRAQLLGQGVDAADPRVRSLEERSWAQYQAARRIFKDAVPAVQAVADSNVKNVEQAKATAQEVGGAGVTVIAVAMLGGAALLLALGWYLARSIGGVLRALQGEAASSRPPSSGASSRCGAIRWRWAPSSGPSWRASTRRWMRSSTPST